MSNEPTVYVTVMYDCPACKVLREKVGVEQRRPGEVVTDFVSRASLLCCRHHWAQFPRCRSQGNKLNLYLPGRLMPSGEVQVGYPPDSTPPAGGPPAVV